MKVCILTTSYPRYEGDFAGIFIHNLAKELVKNDVEVNIVAPHHVGAKRFEIIDGIKVYRFPYFYPAKYQRLAYEGGILPNLRRSNLAKIQVPLLFLSELFYAFKIIRKEKIDVIHSHWIIPSGLVGEILKRILKKKHILTIHATGLFTLERLPLKKKIANFIIKRCDKMTAVSSYIQERMLNFAQSNLLSDIKNKTKIIPMGVDTAIFRPNIDKNELKIKYNVNSENVLLFIGRLAEKKGLSYLIQAMPKIVSKSPNTALIICGDGPLRKESEELVKKMDLDKFVRFTGYVTGRKKIDYFSLSDILIVPSIVTQSGDTEGLPVVILEGLAAGKAVVASNVSGIKDVIKNGYNGFLVMQKNPAAIAEKVLELINNKELMRNISRNALVTSKKYDWGVIGKKYAAIVKSVLRQLK